VPGFAVRSGEKAACKVAIVEPDAGVRFALAACVNSQRGFRCSAAYAGETEASLEIVRQKPDLVLVNHSLPGRLGLGCLVELEHAKSSILGLRYSVFEDSDELFKSTPGGAAGYLLKRTATDRLFDPIADIPATLTPEFVALKLREYFEQLITAMASGPSEVDKARLTPREEEVLTLLAKGYLAKTIASELGISIWTVHGHVKNIFEKFNVHSRTEAVVKYLQK
jgi:DNA-binding NarL/FixJ family response regulator